MNRIFIKKYYLDNTSTLLLPLFFITLSLVIFLQQFSFFSIKNLILNNNALNVFIILVTGFYAALISAVIDLFARLQNYIKKKMQTKEENIKPFIIPEYDDHKVIFRSKQLNELSIFFKRTFKDNKYAFFIGKSGSGKSLLLSEFGIRNRDVTIFSASYYTHRQKLDNKFKTIIKEYESGNIKQPCLIFDQFERAIEDKENFKIIIDFLSKESKNRAISIVFVCMKEKYADVLAELQCNMNNHFEYDTYFLRASSEEKKDILEQIKCELRIEETDRRYIFFDKLLKDLCSGSVSMIEVNIARNYFERTNKDEYMKMSKQNEYPVKEIIEEYFEKVFATIENPDLAMVILYSLCCDEHSYRLTDNDFKNLTFAPNETIAEILRILEGQKIIKKFHKAPESPYIMTHNYLMEYLKVYCKNKLFEKIILNIDFYCKEKNEQHSPSLYYTNTICNKTSSRIITACLILLCIAVSIVSIQCEINGYGPKSICNMEYEWNHNIFALTILAIGSAVFYVYHYLYYFAKIFLSKIGCVEFWLCSLLILFGMFSIVLALWINGLWVTWIAIEWLIIAILHFTLSRKKLPNENARVLLKKESISYLMIGLVLVGLNIWVLKLGSITYPWFVIFILFVCGTIRKHLNTDWVLSKLSNFVSLKCNQPASEFPRGLGGVNRSEKNIGVHYE